MRIAKWLIFISICSVLSIWLYLKFSPYNKINPLQLIPPDAIYIFETEKPLAQWSNFSKSEFWNYLKHQKSLKLLAEDANYLDSLISNNQNLLKLFGDRHFIMSAHMTKSNDYDFLFAFDMKNASKIDLSKIISTSLNKNDFEVNKVTFREHQITKIKDLEDGTYLYLVSIDNYLVCSYALTIIHQCIDHQKKANINDNSAFSQTYKKTSTKGIGQFYLNYQYLDEFTSVYFLNNDGLVGQLGTEFSFTGLDIFLSDHSLNFKGFTSLTLGDSYMRILQKHGNAKLTYQNILSARTAYSQSIHLDNVKAFYTELIQLRETQSGDLAEFKKLKLKFEKTLQLNLEEDFLSWFGNEIVVAQNVSNRLDISEDNLLVAIKVNDLDNAQSKLTLIQKQIKKRTPAKFKQLSYKSHSIHYLDLKGMFNLFFGKTFNKITKPYYTVIEDFVVFSNSPKTLLALIEDYENGYVLANTDLFKESIEQMPREMSLFTFANSSLLYPVLKNYLRAEQKGDYSQNRTYFEFFNSLSLGFTSVDAGFDNYFHSSFSDPSNINYVFEPIAVDSLYQTYVIESGSVQGLSESDLFALEFFDKRKYTLMYPDGKNVKISAKVKNGLLHGSYEEFYLNGKMKIKGRYKKGKKSGLWKYYSIDGSIKEREWQ